jgi:uncharacterized protein DUF6584
MGSSVEELLSRVDMHIQARRLWRAKELLRGAIASGQIDIRILERYGQLLESLEDRIEAGKYLFLSGIRSPEYEPSIRLFLKRHSRAGPRSLVAQFPTTIRHQPFNELPASVIAELGDLGVTASAFSPRRRRPTSKPNRWTGWVIGTAILAIVVAFVVGAISGMRTIVEWLRSVFA